jgi:hypothetical protein
MVEGLCAEITAVVHRHLRAARDVLDSMLARIDGGGADPTRTSVPPPPANGVGAGPTVLTAEPPVKRQPKPETIARKLRKERARAKTAANVSRGVSGSCLSTTLPTT